METNNFKEEYINNQYNKFKKSFENYEIKNKKTIEVMTDGEYYFITLNQAMAYGVIKQKEQLEKLDGEYYYLTKQDLEYLSNKYIIELVLVKVKERETIVENHDKRGDFELKNTLRAR